MTKDIYLAGGCFWGTEHYFKQIEGVAITEVGFANGHTENPTYKEVYTDQTGFAETVFVRFYSLKYNKKNFVCLEHGENFTSYCKDCKKNLCIACEVKHSDNDTMSLGKLFPKESII